MTTPIGLSAGRWVEPLSTYPRAQAKRYKPTDYRGFIQTIKGVPRAIYLRELVPIHNWPAKTPIRWLFAIDGIEYCTGLTKRRRSSSEEFRPIANTTSMITPPRMTEPSIPFKPARFKPAVVSPYGITIVRTCRIENINDIAHVSPLRQMDEDDQLYATSFFQSV